MKIIQQLIGRLGAVIEKASLGEEEYVRFRNFTVILALALPTMIVFAVYDLFCGDYLLFLIALFAAASLCLGWITIFTKKKDLHVYRSSAAVVCFLLVYMVIIGGEGGSKALWIHIFPLVIICLMGRKEGLFWSLLLFVVAFSSMVMTTGDFFFNYSNEYMIRFSFVYFIITGTAYWLEYSRVFFRLLMKSKQSQLAQTLNIFMSGPAVVFKWKNQPGWPVEYVSPNAFGILGYSPEDLTGGRTPYADIIHPDDISRVMDEVAEGSKDGCPYFFHTPYRIVQNNGNIIWVRDYTSVLRNEKNQITHYTGYIVDITRQKEAELRLREQYDFLKTLMDTIPSPIFFKNTEGIYLGCNKAFESASGRSQKDIVGKTVYEMGPREIAEKYEKMDRELFENPGLQTYEWQIKTPQGQFRDVIFNKSTYMNEKSEVIGLIGVITDITERKRAESEREQLIVELQDALDKIKTLSGFIPICSSCKKIRDDSGYWDRIETYIEKHSDALFSHSICPECSEKLYGKEAWFRRKKFFDPDQA